MRCLRRFCISRVSMRAIPGWALLTRSTHLKTSACAAHRAINPAAFRLHRSQSLDPGSAAIPRCEPTLLQFTPAGGVSVAYSLSAEWSSSRNGEMWNTLLRLRSCEANQEISSPVIST